MALGRPPSVVLAAAVVAALGALAVQAPDRGADGDGEPAPAPTPTADSPTPTDDPTAPEPAEPGAMVVWGRGTIGPDLAEDVAALRHVLAAAHVRGDTLGLTGARTAAGASVLELTDGFRVPVSVSAVDPAAYAATLPEGDRADLTPLRPGTALLSRTGAALRGVDAGGALDLLGLPGLVVAGIVPDGLVGRAEVVLHVADADAAGLELDGTLHLRHDAPPGPATQALARAVEGLLDPDQPARVVQVGRDGVERRRAPLVLALAQVKAAFGEFAYRPREGSRDVELAPGFVTDHIVTVEVPLLGRVTCNRGIIDDLRGALEAVIAAGLADEIDPDAYAGCFAPRRISAEGERLSHHAWGIALDVNVDLSVAGGGTPLHPGVVSAFAAHGFRYGGDFLVPDNHHLEWVGGQVTPPPDG